MLREQAGIPLVSLEVSPPVAAVADLLQDLVGVVVMGHASAVAAASIFHFTDQSVIKAHSYMRQAGLDVRMT